jgi:hypothetical protein
MDECGCCRGEGSGSNDPQIWPCRDCHAKSPLILHDQPVMASNSKIRHMRSTIRTNQLTVSFLRFILGGLDGVDGAR